MAELIEFEKPDLNLLDRAFISSYETPVFGAGLAGSIGLGYMAGDMANHILFPHHQQRNEALHSIDINQGNIKKIETHTRALESLGVNGVSKLSAAQTEELHTEIALAKNQVPNYNSHLADGVPFAIGGLATVVLITAWTKRRLKTTDKLHPSE